MKPIIYEVECPSCKKIHIFIVDDLTNTFTWNNFCSCSLIPVYRCGRKPELIKYPSCNIAFNEILPDIESRG